MKEVLTTEPGSLQTVVKGNVTEHAFYATFIGDNGSSGALFCHLKQVVTTKGTNLMGTCTGVLMNDVSEPGTLAVTLTSVFKPKP